VVELVAAEQLAGSCRNGQRLLRFSQAHLIKAEHVFRRQLTGSCQARRPTVPTGPGQLIG
jgi:hypothetical protein